MERILEEQRGTDKNPSGNECNGNKGGIDYSVFYYMSQWHIGRKVEVTLSSCNTLQGDPNPVFVALSVFA